MTGADAGGCEFGPEWHRFIGEIETVVRSGLGDATIAEKIAPLLKRLLDREREGDAIIPPRFKQPRPGQYSQYLLHKATDESVCVISVVWPPGQMSPIHNHGTWGVVGILQNQERETSYRQLDDGSREGYAELEPVGTQILGPGDVTIVLPPDDIHRVESAGDGPAISLHVYGKDIGMRPRRTFDPERRSVKTFVSGYTAPDQA